MSLQRKRIIKIKKQSKSFFIWPENFKLPGFIWAVLFFILAVSSLEAQTYTFTNAGATGRTGPTQSQVNSTYISGNTLYGAVTINTQGIQEWTVPATGTYTIEVWGAEGAAAESISYEGGAGKGARMKGDFSLSAGEVLKILVGQIGKGGTYAGGGGGGAFVAKSNNTPLIVAGGGGSTRSGSSRNYDILNATTSETGVNGTAGSGGTNGNGGTGGTSPGKGGSGGAGFYGDGEASSDTRSMGYKLAPSSFTNGGVGGRLEYTAGGDDKYNVLGGFGGGAAGGWGGAGGGGGYSGGGGGHNSSNTGYGGGGGSFNSGSNQSNDAGVRSGHGQVVITRLVQDTDDDGVADNLDAFPNDPLLNAQPATVDFSTTALGANDDALDGSLELWLNADSVHGNLRTPANSEAITS